MPKLIPVLVCLAVLSTGSTWTREEYQSSRAAFVSAIDPHRVQDHQDMTWSGYRPILTAVSDSDPSRRATVTTSIITEQ